MQSWVPGFRALAAQNIQPLFSSLGQSHLPGRNTLVQMSLLEREKTKTTSKKEIASFLLLTGPTLFSIGPTFSAWVDNKAYFMPLHHSYNVQYVVGSQFLDTPKLELGSAIDWVWNLGNLLHLSVFSSVKWGYDGINLKRLGGFNDIKDIALYLG